MVIEGMPPISTDPAMQSIQLPMKDWCKLLYLIAEFGSHPFFTDHPIVSELRRQYDLAAFLLPKKEQA